ncbi:MAG: peptidase domain-containing ABC transporter [Chitinophagales bacterium]|nr:peptidase domain-containing ABC transporter [Chitinophagales bacterium]
MLKSFPFYQQLDTMDCGPTCLRMVAEFHGKKYSLQYLRERAHISRSGVSLLGISEAAEQIGFRTTMVKAPFEGEEAGLVDAPLPCIVHWQQRHYVVVFKLSKKYVWVADPAAGKFKMTRQQFENGWLQDGDKGIILLLEPGPEFDLLEGQERPAVKGIWHLIATYIQPFRRFFLLLILGLALGSLLQLITPFLTQSVVDVGIQQQNIGFVYLILIAQLTLFVSQTLSGFIQSRLLLFIGARINVGLVSDFLIKIMKLPLGFFDAKMVGDLMQRIQDQKRIEHLLTNSLLKIAFATVNLTVFSIVLLLFDVKIFLVFAFFSVAYVLWVRLFLRKRKEIDYQSFQQMSDNQSNIVELIYGMQEIKLQGSAKKRRWQWANTQARLFRISMKTLNISQYQDAGAGVINQLKNILIVFLSASAVIEGDLTLGMMMAVQSILGQLELPLQQSITFMRDLQDARISLERIQEIEEIEDEDLEGTITMLPPQGDIVLEKLSFRYNTLGSFALKDVDLVIPRGKVTAIVGTSGSGKTTLVKLLLGFYKPEMGSITLGGLQLYHFKKQLWRSRCGAVMQDGYIFSDTIANNIAESSERVDPERLIHAAGVANIREFIERLPLGYNTMIGAKGNGISQGQRQRILIARAVYKDPEFIFLDEATNALDANNEHEILQHLNHFYEGKTVVVVAHRLSTVRNADQIVVLEKGELVEIGNHDSLVQKRGLYYNLVKNQLELGN